MIVATDDGQEPIEAIRHVLTTLFGCNDLPHIEEID